MGDRVKATKGLTCSRGVRIASVLAFGLVALMALGARCIERTYTFVDKDGYTHITGLMVNDTDIQGTRVMLQGTLRDAAGNTVATKVQAPCPPDTQPHSQILFDIRFDNPGVPPFSSFDVRPISGIVLDAPLPDPNVVVLATEAERLQGVPPIPGLPISDNDVFITFGVRNRSGHPYQGMQACVAVYDSFSHTIAVKTTELISIDAAGHIGPATMGSEAPGDVFAIVKDVPTGPTQVQAWLWFGNKADTTSQYQFVETPLITIQTRSIR